MALQGAFFDMDGTVCHTDPIHFRIFKELLLPHGLDIDEEYFRSNISGHANDDILKDTGKKLIDTKEAMFVTAVESGELKPLEGLLDYLAFLKDNKVKMRIVTNAPRPNAESLIRNIGLDGWFPSNLITVGEECERAKPDPCPYVTAMKVEGVCPPGEPAHQIAFEDSPFGVRAAAQAGIFTVGIATSHSADTLKGEGASLVVPDFASKELWDVTKKMLSPQ